MNIQITSISNGYLVMHPPEPVSQMRLERMSEYERQQAQQPITKFGATFDEVVNHIKATWPKE